jgi:hypothetical protein
MARPRERRCKQATFGKGSYCCWGTLAVVHRPRRRLNTRKEEPADVQTQKQKRKQQQLDRARAKLTAARAKHIEQTKALGRTMKRIAQLERSVAAYERSVAKLALEPAHLRAMDV